MSDLGGARDDIRHLRKMFEDPISALDMARWEHEWQHLNGLPCRCEIAGAVPISRVGSGRHRRYRWWDKWTRG